MLKTRSKIKGIISKAQYIVFSFLGFIYRSVRYRNEYFFDTNFIISAKSQVDNRYKKLRILRKNFYITSQVESEYREKLENPRFEKINKHKLKTISFDDLHSKIPICPVYYNFLSALNNPANINSPDFNIQLILSKFMKNKSLTIDEKNLYEITMKELMESAHSKEFPDGTIKDELSMMIDNASFKSIKKRKKSLFGNKNYMNDIRSLATIFTYSLINRNNITYISADSDSVAYFLDWSSTLIQQVVFNTKCLEILNRDRRLGMKKVIDGRKEAIFFEPMDMQKEIAGTTQKFYSNHKKYFSPRFTLKYWNREKKKFFNLSVNIDDVTRQFLLSSHGNLNCPTTKNDEMGSFIGYKYWWPPADKGSGAVLKILPIVKPISKDNLHMPPELHDSLCMYRRFDLLDDFSHFSSFI